ncbi:MAG: response regulator [Ignavibacteriaceae bacterium]
MTELKNKKVLLVDDDLDLLEQHKLLFESRGYNVVTADNSKDGFEMFRKEKPDAAVIDLIMEEHDSGFILCYKIKKDDHGKTIPVFMLTSAAYDTGFKFSSATDEEKEWIKVDEIIHKPVVIDDLVEKIENYYGMIHNQ